MNRPEAALSGRYPSSATTPERIQPAWTACIGGSDGCLCYGLTELAHRRGAAGLAVAVPVQAAGHAGRLARLGERVHPVNQDRRRAMHSPPVRLLLVSDHMTADHHVAAAFPHP